MAYTLATTPMLPLDHDIWDHLHCHNIGGREFAQILAGYYACVIPDKDGLYEDLLQCICGGSVYDSSYAAAPHLVRLAAQCDVDSAAAMLCFAAHAIAAAAGHAEDSPAVDPLLEPGLREASTEGLRVVPRILSSLDARSPEMPELLLSHLAFSGDTAAYQSAISKLYDAA